MKHKRKNNDELLFEIFSRLLLAFFFNFIGSAIPEWSSSIFILNLALISAGIIVSIIFYKKVSDSRTMWNRVGFVLFLLMGFFLVTPFLRIAYGTSIFWVLLAAYLIYIFNFILRYLDVFHGVQVSGLTTNRYMMIWVTFLLFIGSFFLTNENGNIVLQIFDADAPPLIFPIVFYLGGLLMTLMSFTLLVDN
ncbi:hypothetical protein J7E42_06105 [Bacillus sp. ISL-37]|nr:hypothetical protein [Bacillus sp. ISL-37]